MEIKLSNFKHMTTKQKDFMLSIITAFCLVGSAILFYLPSLHYDFQFDDVANITRQFSIRSKTFWSLFLTGPRWMSYWLNTIHYTLGKFDPFSYRFFNVIIHSASSLLIFILLSAALKKLKNAPFFKHNAYTLGLCSAVIFLLHPVQTQTVSYVIQGQLEGMAVFFCLCCLVGFFYATHSTTLLAKSSWFFLSILSAFLATGCKEIVIVLPLLVFLFDWFFIAQGCCTLLKNHIYKHGCITVLVLGLYTYFLKPSFFIKALGLQLSSPNNIGNILTHNAQDSIMPYSFFISQFKVMLHYLQIFVWPFSMSVEYDWKLVTGLFSIGCLLPLVLLSMLCYGTYRLLRKNSSHPLAFCSLWFFVSVLPRCSIIPSSELLADYKTYLASVGLCFLLACAFVWLLKSIVQRYLYKHTNKTEWFMVLSISILGLLLGAATLQRNKIWRSAENFWLNIIKNAPQKARAYNNYAVALSERGAYKEAIPFFEQAIAMDARYPDPLNNVAVAYSIVNDTVKAVAALTESVRINPHYPEAYNNLASLFIKQEKLEYAEHMLKVALQLRPYYGKAFFNMAKVWLMRNDHNKAHEFLRKACLEADFDNEIGYKSYADLSMYLNKAEDAIIGYSRLVEIAPSAENIFGLANAHFMANDSLQAIALYQKALRIDPQARYWYNLAEAYIKTNKFQQALDAFKHTEQLKHSLPTLCLRQAYCYDQLGRKIDAIKSAQESLRYENLPEQHRNVAQSMLAQAQQEGWLQKV